MAAILRLKKALRCALPFEHALIMAEDEFFPILRKEVLEVRLRRIEEAAKLLYLNSNGLGSLNSKKELNQLANDLACLQGYAVGPAFDKLKFSSVPIANSEISGKSGY